MEILNQNVLLNKEDKLKDMLSRDEILKQPLGTKAYLANLKLEQSGSRDRQDSKILLDELEDEFRKNWPLENTEKAESVGAYAARILMDGPYKDLPKMMIRLGADMGGLP